MNQKEWRKISRDKTLHASDIWYYRNLAIKYFNLKKGFVIHHLRDTPEQREFNDKYYERWGFDFDNVMKYCVCISVEEHRNLHKFSEETRKKMSESAKKRGGLHLRGRKLSEEQIEYMRRINTGRKMSKEAIEKAIRTKKEHGTDKKSAETRLKMSLAAKGVKKSPEHCKHTSEGLKKAYAEGKIVPWNKGTKGICKPNSTSFKKGQTNPQKGMSYEEIFGKEKAKRIKQKISNAKKGKPNLKAVGKKRTPEQIARIIEGTRRAKEKKKLMELNSQQNTTDNMEKSS